MVETKNSIVEGDCVEKNSIERSDYIQRDGEEAEESNQEKSSKSNNKNKTCTSGSPSSLSNNDANTDNPVDRYKRNIVPNKWNVGGNSVEKNSVEGNDVIQLNCKKKGKLNQDDGNQSNSKDIAHRDVSSLSLSPSNNANTDNTFYRNKRIIAQGMMDFALFSANVLQFRYLLSNKDHSYFIVALVAIVISIVLQVAIGFLLLRVYMYSNDEDKTKKSLASKQENLSVYLILLLLITNVFISVFGV